MTHANPDFFFWGGGDGVVRFQVPTAVKLKTALCGDVKSYSYEHPRSILLQAVSAEKGGTANFLPT